MSEHPTITALRATAPHELSPIPWETSSGAFFVVHTPLGALADVFDAADAAHIVAAVNAAPHLLAELDALRAQVAAAREAVRRLVGSRWVRVWDRESLAAHLDGGAPC